MADQSLDKRTMIYVYIHIPSHILAKSTIARKPLQTLLQMILPDTVVSGFKIKLWNILLDVHRLRWWNLLTTVKHTSDEKIRHYNLSYLYEVYVHEGVCFITSIRTQSYTQHESMLHCSLGNS